jgi:hypothetical protein
MLQGEKLTVMERDCQDEDKEMTDHRAMLSVFTSCQSCLSLFDSDFDELDLLI